MLLIFLLLFTIQGILNAMSCSSQCSSFCQKIQLSCTICLNASYQTINSTTKDCSCINGYQPFQGFNTYCCPIGCKSCNKQGCSECHSNQILLYNSTLKANICVCKQHYILNRNGRCICSSITLPQVYYFDDYSMSCIVCPSNCICSSQGCISCSESTNRKIIKLQHKNSSCHCKNGFREVAGICQCPKDCNCSDPLTIICSSQSNRYNSTGNYECIWPYQNIGITCQCLYPYIQILNWNDSLTCQCSSKKDYYSFFLYKNQCSFCYEGCSCNQNGCYQCNSLSSISKLNHCYCANNYTIINSKCQCLFPYYYSSSNQTFCYCLSELDSSKYFYIKSEQKCYACPPGCTCNQNGCISCENGNLRKIKQLSSTQFVCPCVQNTGETSEGICYCKEIYNKNNNQCICDTRSLKTVFINDIDTEQCQICPMSCKCDSTGCHQCSQQSNRIINTNSQGIQTCHCKQNFTSQNYAQKCICAGNYTLLIPTKIDRNDSDYDDDDYYDDDYDSQGDNDTVIPVIQQCVCQLPWYQTDNGQCRCMSQVESTNYYWDFIDNKCFFCPFNCICNDFGCISCSDDALRTISFDQKTNLSICPCLQNSYLNGNYCTICTSSQYYYSGSCIPCRGCVTCDRRGCLTCGQQQTLMQFECVCNFDGFINNGDYCGCEDGYSRYNAYYVISCQKCPVYCQVCLITIQQDICLKCPQGVHRANFPSRNCECQDGYIQAYPMQVFCCHYSCQSCNKTSCLTCPLYSYRAIINSTCQCVYPLLEINKGACICDNLYYLMNGTCFKCPQSCKSCSYLPNQSFIRCTSCNEGMNRNMSHINCSCLPGFIETHPIKSPFCVLQHCTQDVVNCSSCLNTRVLHQEICQCPPSTFQNYLKTCQNCNIQGCFQCQQYLLCYQCDTNNSFFLSNLRCYYSNLTSTSMVFYVGIKRILIQFKLQLKMQQYISSTLSIVRIQSPHSIKAYHAIPLNVEYEHLNEDFVLTTIFQNTNQTYSNLLLSYNITYLSKTEKLISDKDITVNTTGSSSIKYHQQNIYQSVILSTQIMENFKPTQQSSASFAASIFFSIMAYVFYILGYKHNQLMFYLQSMSFYGFVIDRTPIANVVFLYNLRYTYFNYDRNPLEKVIPINYIENCKGNYFITSTDCNMIRNIGLSLVLALTIGVLLIVTRIVHYFLRTHFKLDVRFIHYKKLIYRTLEFFHKATMFPLIFFSIQTLVNAETTVLIRSDFKTSCNVLAAIILVIYFFYTLLEIFYNIMSKLYKIQNCIQFISNVFASLIIIKAESNETLIGVVIIVVIKDIIYAILRHKYMNQKASYLLLVATIFSIAAMAMIISKSNRWGVVSVHVVAGFVHLIIYSLLTYWFFQMGKFDKILILPIGVASEADLMKFENQDQK